MDADRIGSVGATNTDGDGGRNPRNCVTQARRSGRLTMLGPELGDPFAGICTAIFSRDLYLLWRYRTQQNHNRLNQ
jgi:hypothetical protein